MFYSGEADRSTPCPLPLGPYTLLAAPAVDAKLAVINDGGLAGFRICNWCGFALAGSAKAPSPHPTPWGGECKGALAHYHLGHEFKTDILELRFEGYMNDQMGFWYSLLYALLDGVTKRSTSTEMTWTAAFIRTGGFI